MKNFWQKKLIFSILTICLFSILLLPQIILADTPLQIVQGGLQNTAVTATISQTQTDLPTILGKAINYFFPIIGVIFLTVTLIGGYLWMTAGGNEEKVEKAKKFVMNGINGMIVIFLGYALVFVIVQALSGAIGG